MNIQIYGTDPRLKYCKERLIRESYRALPDMIILPVPSTRDGVTVNGTDVTVESVVRSAPCGSAIVCYGFPRDLRQIASERAIAVIDVSRDEELLLANADLTAVGTVGRILTEDACAPSGLSIGIIGYGRIGQRLLYILSFLGARITVFTSKKELRKDLCMLGISGVDSTSLEEAGEESLSSLDILINTAPARLIPASFEISSELRIIELASGDNMPPGTVCERFMSVPATMYPKSAGEALAESVLRILGEG